MKTNYAVSPGEYLDEFIYENNQSMDYVCKALSISKVELKSFLEGKLIISDSLAIKLEKLTSLKKQVWLRIQERYIADLKRLNKDVTMVTLDRSDRAG